MKRVTVMALERYRWCAIFVNLLIAHRKIEKKKTTENSISVSFIEGSSLGVTSPHQLQHRIDCFRLNICYATKDTTQLWAQHHINNEPVEINYRFLKLVECAATFVVCGLTQTNCYWSMTCWESPCSCGARVLCHRHTPSITLLLLLLIKQSQFAVNMNFIIIRN